ncbi:MAG: D-alanyl-D-alanine carboxypeptidase family protein, partial [Gammaproteobacteria bacterium]
MHSTFTRFQMLAALLLFSGLAHAVAVPVPAPPSIDAGGYLLVDHHSGRVLASENADERFPPASITKVMTAYVVFKKLQEGAVALDDPVLVSENAWRTGGSRTFVDVGSRVPLVDLLQGMIVQSGNDASVALAEHVAGSEETFAALMNEYARVLGMENTHFVNSTGWPDPEHYTTARDIATLAEATIDEFPDYYHWYAQKEFTWNEIRQPNRNQLLWRDPSVDGLKTGHTEDAGYCLLASAEREGMRLTSVILGSSSEQNRTTATQSLLNYGFNFYETRRLFEAGKQIAETRIYKGVSEQAPLGVAKDLYVTVQRGQFDELEASMDLRATIVAPIDTSQPLGEVQVRMGEDVIAKQPLHALAAVGAG